MHVYQATYLYEEWSEYTPDEANKTIHDLHLTPWPTYLSLELALHGAEKIPLVADYLAVNDDRALEWVKITSFLWKADMPGGFVAIHKVKVSEALEG